MLRLHSKDVLTLVVICYVAVTVIGLRFKPRKINERSTSQMELIGQPTFNTSQSLKSNTSSWTHEESAVVVDNLPTKRQTQSADVDNPEESLFDIFHDKPIKEEFITNKDNAGPAYRRVIIIPNTVDALRIPHPYPFHPVRVLDPVIDPVRFIPSPLHIHHYRRVPVPVEVPKYQHIPQPYYVPYKPKPDYTVTDVQVYDPVNPCLNGGLPLASQFGYHCLCSKDYHGRFCDAKLYCSSSPCQNGGVCEEKENNYQCQCKDGYLGYNCEDKNLCRPNPCKNDGQCVETSTNYRCYCRPGFIGKACENLDYCDPNPCQNGGSCQQRMGFHECICHEQYKGKLCEQKRVCYSNPCKNGGKCVEDDPRFNCLCPHGYMLPHCKVHVCESNPCLNGGKCVSRKEDGYRWTYHCICSLLFKGDKCEIPNPCVTNPCLHGGSCIDSYSKYTGFPKDWNIGYLHYYCLCPPEYSGQKCEDNLCLKCDVNAFCNHGRCVCNEGFRGDGFKCNATEDPCIPNPCLNNGTCSNGPDESFDCTCPQGYFPPLCTKPFDHCIPNPCKNGGTCVKDGNSFHCICPVDYLLPDCANKTVNPCIPNPCQNKATCQPTEDKKSFTCNCKGSFKPPLCTCGCPKGNPAWTPPILPQKCTESGDCYCPEYSGKTYSMTEQGCVEATKRNPCESNPCKNGGKCFNSQDGLSFTCQCPEECTGDLCQNCDPVKICPSGYCKNGGTCIIVGIRPFCKCPSGYLPPECAKIAPENRNVCHPNPCQNGGTCRKVRADAYECSCLVQFHGKHCERDKCMDCDVHANCHNGRCRCRRGYKGTGLKGDCKQELVCHTCPLNAVCVDGECSCIKGFYFIDNTCKIEDGG